MKTSAVEATLNPQWGTDDMPVIFTHVTSTEEFADCQLNLSFYDRSLGKDAYMGDAIITLKEAVANFETREGPTSPLGHTMQSNPLIVKDIRNIPNKHGKTVAPAEFEVVVNRHGKRAGTCRGKFIIIASNVEYMGAKAIQRAQGKSCCALS